MGPCFTKSVGSDRRTAAASHLEQARHVLDQQHLWRVTSDVVQRVLRCLATGARLVQDGPVKRAARVVQRAEGLAAEARTSQFGRGMKVLDMWSNAVSFAMC